jgi:SAM domain (Sterile alpha motif)
MTDAAGAFFVAGLPLQAGLDTMTSKGMTIDVGRWLRGLGLGQYEATFRENAIDFDQDQCPRMAQALSVAHWIARTAGRTVLAEPLIAVKVSTARPSSRGYFRHAAVHVPLPQSRIPRSGLCCRRFLGGR